MKLKWDIYFYNLWSAVLKSIGVQGVSWSGINGLSAAGMDVPSLNLKTLGWMFLLGAVAPALFKFWERTPLPEIIEDTTTTTTTTTKTKVSTEAPEETSETLKP